MTIESLINKKKEGQKLNLVDIDFLVKNFTNKKISDLKMGEFLKIIHQYEMKDDEILNLFISIFKYSQKINFSKVSGFKIDKHSTGGIGDNTSIILMPLLSVLGLKIFKLSGSRLGHTGGTIDKMKIFPGIKLDYSAKEFEQAATKHDLVLSSPIEDLSFFEKKVYYLRTQTRTTQNLGLIVNSIMIKKIALKNDGLLIDIKIGKGSLFQSLNDVKNFCRLVEKICNKNQRKYKIVYSNMNQPLGNAIGTKLEILEAIKTMQGNGPQDLVELVTELAGQALIMANYFQDLEKAKAKVIQVLKSGIVFQKFKKWIEFQNGTWEKILKNPKIKAKNRISIKSPISGYVWIPDASLIGEFLNRINLTDKFQIDNESGIFWKRKNNIFVKKDEEIFVFYTNKSNIDVLIKEAKKLFVIKKTPSKNIATILKTI